MNNFGERTDDASEARRNSRRQTDTVKTMKRTCTPIVETCTHWRSSALNRSNGHGKKIIENAHPRSKKLKTIARGMENEW